MKIKVLGPGCVNCQRLETNVKAAVEALGLEADIEKVSDFQEILKYGVMSTPGLVVEEKVISVGRVPTKEDIQKMLQAIR